VRRLIVLPALGLALAACTSSTVGGHATLVGPSPAASSSASQPPPGSSPTFPAAPSTTTSVAPPTTTSAAPPAPTPTSAPDPNLNCAAGSVTATGAPFCYPLPAAFSDFSTQGNYGAGWTYKTLVSAGGHDLIEVLGGVYANDTDAMSAAELRTFFDRSGLLVKGKFDIVAAGGVVATQVDGHRAFSQTGRYRNGVRALDTRVYAGRTVVAIYCQSKARTPQVLAACTQIREQIHIAHL
jgi:hypothetical protein